MPCHSRISDLLSELTLLPALSSAAGDLFTVAVPVARMGSWRSAMLACPTSALAPELMPLALLRFPHAWARAHCCGNQGPECCRRVDGITSQHAYLQRDESHEPQASCTAG